VCCGGILLKQRNNGHSLILRNQQKYKNLMKCHHLRDKNIRCTPFQYRVLCKLSNWPHPRSITSVNMEYTDFFKIVCKDIAAEHIIYFRALCQKGIVTEREYCSQSDISRECQDWSNICLKFHSERTKTLAQRLKLNWVEYLSRNLCWSGRREPTSRSRLLQQVIFQGPIFVDLFICNILTIDLSGGTPRSASLQNKQLKP